MPHLDLTPEQMQIVEQRTSAVEVRTPSGKVLARILPPAEEELVARILARRGQRGESYPAEVVEARLQRLQEIREREGMDEAKMWDLRRRMRAGEKV
jgi:hypothetical protein